MKLKSNFCFILSSVFTLLLTACPSDVGIDDPVNYTVTFNSGAGTAIDNQIIVDGGKVLRPVNPTREEYTFINWYKDSDYTTLWDFDNDLVISDLTLYAKWRINTYTVYFHSDSGNAIDSLTISSGVKVTKPADPAKDGFIFINWYSDEDLTALWDFDNDVAVADLTLYAKWLELVIGGKGPAGGWIFYDKGTYSDGWRYMEAAPTDIVGASPWGSVNVLTGADGTAIGTGKENTSKIITVDTARNDKAADNCNKYSLVNNGVIYDDWFLPSIGELNEMYMKLQDVTVKLGGFRSSSYYSSTEKDKDYVYNLSFLNGYQSHYVKYVVPYIRPVRSF